LFLILLKQVLQVFFPLENKPCTDPNDNPGTCVTLKNCSWLYKIYKSKPLSNDKRTFLRKSQCGAIGHTPYVCCAEESNIKAAVTETSTQNSLDTTATAETPDWLKSLKKKLPQPPACGIEVAERIFGGEVVPVGGFPWAVLLQYTKSKLHIHIS
jgi:hypothetical protein